MHAANGFAPEGLKGVFSALATGGIIFSYLGFEQADQLAGEAANPKRDIPWAIIGSVLIGTVIYVLLQVAFLFALPHSAIGSTWSQTGAGLYTSFHGPFADLATLLSLGWLATVIKVDAVISPAGTGLIYTTGSSRLAYGLSRNGYVPSVFEWTSARGVPWVGLIAAFVTGCVCFLPFPSLAVAGRPDRERLGADVRRCAALARGVPPAAARREPSLPDPARRGDLLRWPSSSRT